MKHKEKQKHLEGRHFIKTARMSRGPCNTQDKTRLPKSPLEAPACGQAEGKKFAFCKPINVIFSPSKGCMEVHMLRKTRRDEDVFHEPLQNVSCTGASEMPAFQPVRKQKSTERHIQAKLNSGDASQRRHKAEAPTQHQKAWKASSSESFPSISSKDRQNDAGPCNTQDKTPLPKSPLEAPACGQAAGKKSAFCEPFTDVFSPSKPCMEIHMFGKTRHDEDVFHQPLQKVSCTAASEMPAFQPVRKQKSTERHIQAKLNSGDASQRRHKAEAPTQRQKAWKASSSESFPSISSKDKQNDAGRCISQDNVPRTESPVEAPACGPAAGEKSSFSEHPIGVSTPSKRARLDDDVFHQPLQKVSCTAASEMPAFQPVRKQKSTEGHIQANLNSGDALQRRHKAEAPTQRQKAWKASSSEILPCISSKDRQNDAGPCNTQDKAPLSKSPLEAPAFGQAEGKKSAFCKPINVVFSPSKGCMKIHMFGKTRRDEDVFHQPLQNVSCTAASEMPAFQPVRKQKSTERHIQAKLNSGDALQHKHRAVALTQCQKAWKASSSEILPCISSKDRQNDAGRRISQDNVPQTESPVEAPACGPAAGEKSSFSEHPIGVSTPSKRARLDDDEIKEMTVSQDSEETENSSDYSHTYIPSHPPNNNEPFMSPVHGTDVRPMKIYYMHVQLKRGVAVLYHTKEGWEPPSKKIKMEEMTYIGKVHKNVPVYHMSEKKHLIAHEPMLDSGAQEKREEADSPAQPPALGWYPSAKTPEWLVALDSGFRCMACCRVFPSLAILQDHVEYGVREGFSCHVFHNAMAHLKFKARIRRKKEKEEKALFRR